MSGIPGMKRFVGTPEERFRHFTEVTDYCWQWKGFVNHKGYGRLNVNGRLVMAHRFSLQLVGIKIPIGMMVDHKCRNRSCVNPDHLRVVTPRINAIENSNSIPAKFAQKDTCPKGHLYDTVHVRKTGAQQRVCKTCMRDYTRERRAAK